MLEPLSESRCKLLFSLQLCSRADLRRAAGGVRRLARDLPAFDSVWLDALVQMGRLTPFQARMLETNQGQQLQVGPCVLVDRLGAGPLGETFVARPRGSRDQCVTRILKHGAHLTPPVEQELTRVVEALRGLEHPSVAVPRSLHPGDRGLVVVSRYVPGYRLAELLVRRGRFPPAVVWEIGRQMAEGLAALERRGVVHGDLRSSKVRLTRAGLAVLVDPGIRAAIENELSAHAALHPDRYDGVAPELIGRVARPTVASDMYALGCLLWQLLAGRPPFPGGDPLVKLAAHQTRTVGDVRHWAPETPAALAQGIARMTARAPEDRPARFSQLLELWGAPRPAGRRRLAAFSRWFERPAPWNVDGGRLEGSRLESRTRSGPAVPRLAGRVLLVVALAAAVFALRHEGAKSLLLSWTSNRTNAVGIASSPSSETESDKHEPDPQDASKSASQPAQASFAPIPVPDPQGVIRLTGPGPFLARDIHVVGALAILGDEASGPSQVVVVDQPLRLSAETVRIRNVALAVLPTDDATQSRLPALALVQSQSLDVERCVWNASSAAPDKPIDDPARLHSQRTGLGWKLLAPRDPRGGRAAIRDTIFIGGDAALYLTDAVGRLEFVNCLRLGGGPLAQLPLPADSRTACTLRLERSTCRAAANLVRVTPPPQPTKAGALTIETSDCVFDLLRPEEGLVEFAAGELPGEIVARIKMTGEGSLAPLAVEPLVARAPDTGDRAPIAVSQMSVEGIFAGPYEFAGPFSLEPADAVVRSYEAPRRSASPPGYAGTVDRR